MTIQGFVDQLLANKPANIEEESFKNDFEFNLNGQPLQIGTVTMNFPEPPREGEPEPSNPPQPTIEITTA